MNNKYLHRFFKLSVAPMLLEKKLFPNIKEITESFAAFVAVKDRLGINQKTSDILIIVVGDGHTPRTAGLFACLSKWEVASVDPQMRIKNYGIKRISLFKKKIEELSLFCWNKDTVIVCVHSHAKLSDCFNSVNGYRSLKIVNIPCCYQSDLNVKPFEEYIDEGIQSDKNKVELYDIR